VSVHLKPTGWGNTVLETPGAAEDAGVFEVLA
jgi:hypothetical protein